MLKHFYTIENDCRVAAHISTWRARDDRGKSANRALAPRATAAPSLLHNMFCSVHKLERVIAEVRARHLVGTLNHLRRAEGRGKGDLLSE